ncbi:MAG: ABC transporter ATP-binding protein, partial [Lachnospiraceae bacterium]|nr:ABC transporter ATP-binding protein [Lachnospiraceae bacterium]
MLYFLKGSKRWFALSILLACLVSVLDLINPRIIGYTVDTILGQKESELPGFADALVRRVGGSDFLRSHLYYIAAAVLAAALLGALCRYLFNLTNSLGAEKLVLTMRNTLFRHILKLPYAWHGTQQTGDIIQRCTSDVEMIKRFLSEQMAGLFRISLLIVLAVVSMLRIHPLLTLAAAGYIPIIVGYSLFFHSRIGDSFEKVDVQEGKLSAIAQENLTGVRVVRAFGREQYERSRFETQNEQYTRMWVRLMQLLSAFFAVGDLFSGLQILTVVALGAVLCVHDRITPGNYI